ncbi:integrative conjugative element protein, RAQPRD family [Serratia ficaria]|uniref:integrative conjugative element protein, RAQPRD family n=1 Tax=Serratia ficaria TaxID=61651 RepID=UPI00217A80E9|nr:RAQPRD family integrative conjugative element protein [Serratia ficaria]CAI1232724.1 integrative conjugative element protein, RAQPRD family [Serratia ficaria]CAI1244091.1 integrative conjugative element protein, RAQPRD family [Serratia ficaria]CAI2537459.1 integrative conjugative element protein, RAQPRD family [Serratia ficaria]CAI2537462.1 integrative conjugative element protein, RAQPRD family [Serratia ficaria]CAI2539441.1 integrative conjugative element protein, RAQPRD family [Serratia f
MAQSYCPALARRSALAALLLAGLWTALPAVAADDSNEKEHLAAVVRQLDLLERLAKRSAATASQERARYHFDYTRLTADLQRMRAGINDYLTPQRAQPRDPAALQGDYRQDSEQEPKK